MSETVPNAAIQIMVAGVSGVTTTPGLQSSTVAEDGGGVATSIGFATASPDPTVQVSATSQGTGFPDAGASATVNEYLEVVGPPGVVPLIISASLTTTFTGKASPGNLNAEATASLSANTLGIASYEAFSSSDQGYMPDPQTIAVEAEGAVNANELALYTIAATAGSGELSVTGPANGNDYTVTASVDPTIVIDPAFANASDYSIVFSANPACFAATTLILTDCDERAVESLAIGDCVITAAGEALPIRWIGRRSYAGRFLAANPQVQPIRFRAGCLGNHLPHRDLLVSPEHAMLLDGVLIPARCLVNGSSIVRESTMTRVDYFHVELTGC